MLPSRAQVQMVLEHLTEHFPGVGLQPRLQLGVLQAARLAALQPTQRRLEEFTGGGERLHRCRLDRLDRLGHDRLARRAATRASSAVSPAAACSSRSALACAYRASAAATSTASCSVNVNVLVRPPAGWANAGLACPSPSAQRQVGVPHLTLPTKRIV